MENEVPRLAGIFLMPLAVLLGFECFCVEEKKNYQSGQQWGGLNLMSDLKLQILILPSPTSIPTSPSKVHYILRNGEQTPVRFMRERSLSHLINTVKSILQRFSQYVVEGHLSEFISLLRLKILLFGYE